MTRFRPRAERVQPARHGRQQHNYSDDDSDDKTAALIL